MHTSPRVATIAVTLGLSAWSAAQSAAAPRPSPTPSQAGQTTDSGGTGTGRPARVSGWRRSDPARCLSTGPQEAAGGRAERVGFHRLRERSAETCPGLYVHPTSQSDSSLWGRRRGQVPLAGSRERMVPAAAFRRCRRRSPSSSAIREAFKSCQT